MLALDRRGAELRADLAVELDKGVVLDAAAAEEVTGRWVSQLEGVQSLLAEHAAHLPSYDAETAQQSFGKLRDEVDAARAKVKPKKKFAFGRRGKEASTSGRGPPSDTDKKEPAAEASSAASDALLERLTKEETTVEGLSGTTVVLGPEAKDDVRLVRLKECVVLVERQLSALRVDGLEQCWVVTMPVAGSVLLHDCEDCTLVMAARQFRLHRSVRCRFFLHALSGPIIERCSEVAFGPYSVMSRHGEDMKRRLVEAGLLETREGASSKDAVTARQWREVNDFQWIKATASPNWRELGTDEWIRPVDLPSSISGHGWFVPVVPVAAAAPAPPPADDDEL
jgi:tubulin-specific chaperone C